MCLHLEGNGEQDKGEREDLGEHVEMNRLNEERNLMVKEGEGKE